LSGTWDLRNVISEALAHSKDDLQKVLEKLTEISRLNAEHRDWMADYDTVSSRVSANSFRPYILNNDVGSKLRALKINMDEKSQRNAEMYITRILNTPDISTANYWLVRKEYWDSLSSEDYRINSAAFALRLDEIKTQFRLAAGDGSYAEDVFWYHHGLRTMPGAVKDYIKGKDFIDGGAYVGDSAMMLIAHYEPKKVWSFEISPTTIAGYLKNMELNGVDPGRYDINQIGLWRTKDKVFIEDSAHQGTSLLSPGDCAVDLTDLDSFVQERGLQTGFIKSDLEGAGLDALRGMKETIRRDRPVLSLSIHRTPEEYFEIKPLLESFVDGYSISLAQLNSPWNNFEISLLAYPGELDRL
jgi:FkbM family methyltransferase